MGGSRQAQRPQRAKAPPVKGKGAPWQWVCWWAGKGVKGCQQGRQAAHSAPHRSGQGTAACCTQWRNAFSQPARLPTLLNSVRQPALAQPTAHSPQHSAHLQASCLALAAAAILSRRRRLLCALQAARQEEASLPYKWVLCTTHPMPAGPRQPFLAQPSARAPCPHASRSWPTASPA